MWRIARGRGVPVNETVLRDLLTRRFEFARLLDYSDWADYVTADKMIGASQGIAEFLAVMDDALAGQRALDVAALTELNDGNPVQPWDTLYSALSHNLHSGNPADLDFEEVERQAFLTYGPVAPIAGAGFRFAFPHLTEYSAIYYTYVWSQVIAKDLMTAFADSDQKAWQPTTAPPCSEGAVLRLRPHSSKTSWVARSALTPIGSG